MRKAVCCLCIAGTVGASIGAVENLALLVALDAVALAFVVASWAFAVKGVR